jgi:hypothetical protein
MNFFLNYYILKRLITIIAIILPHIYSYDHWINVTDETFEWETSYDDIKWLLFFDKNDCKNCKIVYNIINSILHKFIDKKVGFILIDSLKCPWLVNRFNVSYLPKIILLENKLMYDYHSNYNEKNIINFINKKKQKEISSPIPSGAKIKNIYTKYGTILSHKINNSMQYYLDKFHIPLKWNKYYTITFVIILIMILIFLWIFILILFCRIIKEICFCGLCRRKKITNKKKLKEKIE